MAAIWRWHADRDGSRHASHPLAISLEGLTAHLVRVEVDSSCKCTGHDDKKIDGESAAKTWCTGTKIPLRMRATRRRGAPRKRTSPAPRGVRYRLAIPIRVLPQCCGRMPRSTIIGSSVETRHGCAS
jgi:hypothetical protein